MFRSRAPTRSPHFSTPLAKAVGWGKARAKQRPQETLSKSVDVGEGKQNSSNMSQSFFQLRLLNPGSFQRLVFLRTYPLHGTSGTGKLSPKIPMKRETLLGILSARCLSTMEKLAWAEAFQFTLIFKFLCQTHHVESPGAQEILFYWVSVFSYFKGWNTYSGFLPIKGQPTAFSLV